MTGWGTPSRPNTCGACSKEPPHVVWGRGFLPHSTTIYQCLVLGSAFELFLIDWHDPVFEEPPREPCAESGADRDFSLVVRANREGNILFKVEKAPALIVIELFVDLDVFATGESNNATTLVTV